MRISRYTAYIPAWLGPAAYILTVIILVMGGMIGLSAIAGAPRPEAKMQAKPRAIARAPLDTPDTAPELSPVFATTDYGSQPVPNNAARAREQARSASRGERTPRRETTGSGWARSRNPMDRPDEPR